MDSKALLYAGLTVSCTLRDGSTLSVKLRLIKISEIPAYLDASLDEHKALVFCLESPVLPPGENGAVHADAIAFFDSLSDESYTELVAKNTDLNFTRALAMGDQRLKRSESTGAGLAQLAASLSSLLSRFSASSASPPATPANNSSP